MFFSWNFKETEEVVAKCTFTAKYVYTASTADQAI